MPSCSQCSTAFDISDADHNLYERLHVPEPTTCGICSERLRFSFRNERRYYKRKCDMTGKDIVSIYAPDSPYKVYHREAWFSDTYDPTTYGREIDFDRPFFDQLYDLSLVVPYEHMVIMNSINCDYCNFILNSKNCYLSVRIEAEDVSYCHLAIKCKDCIDCHTVLGCELCYECVDCLHCYASHWCQRCKQCSDCSFCIDCIGCKHCFGCSGLRQKEYHIFNQPFTPDSYRTEMEKQQAGSYQTACQAHGALRVFDGQRPHRPVIIELSEDVSGDYIIKSRNVQRSFDIEECQDASESHGCEYCKDIARGCFLYHSELCYEHMSSTNAHSVRFCYGVYDSWDVEYCVMMQNGTHDAFGSIGLKHNAFVILNKQYTEEEYRSLRSRLVDHMKQTGEYGQYFPPRLSYFAYNETAAQEFYPLTKEQALALGYRWRDSIDEPPASTIPVLEEHQLQDTINEVTDDILNSAIRCARSGRLFRLTKKELEFYRAHGIPLPRLHPDERHYARMRLRNPRKLWDRHCQKCGKDIQTTYAPDRPEIVYCEDCYLKEVY